MLNVQVAQALHLNIITFKHNPRAHGSVCFILTQAKNSVLAEIRLLRLQTFTTSHFNFCTHMASASSHIMLQQPKQSEWMVHNLPLKCRQHLLYLT